MFVFKHFIRDTLKRSESKEDKIKYKRSINGKKDLLPDEPDKRTRKWLPNQT